MRIMFPDTAEERLKKEFFADARAGFFVDVGANEPQQGSQSWYFEQAGWTGILVEPQPDLATRLMQSRRAQVIAAACSSPENAGRMMALHLSGPLSSLNRDLVVAGVVPHGSVEVPVRTLDDILVEGRAPSPIDFVSIDVEGHGLEVLRGFDIARWRPRLILMEDHVTSLATHRFLTGAGYRLMRRTGLNAWYVPQSEAPRVGLFGAWQIARKYYLALPIRIIREYKRHWRDRLRLRLSASRRDSSLGNNGLISLIVTTYQNDDALDAVLRALARQTERNFEIVVAEDAMRPETARLVEAWAPRLPVPLKHVRHEHKGFRVSEIRNRGIAASAGELCIFLDGDCLPRADFIAAHRRLAAPGWFVAGNRILLSEALTKVVLSEKRGAETWTFATLLRERLRGGINRLLPALHLPLGPLRKLRAGDWRDAKTCNLAVARSDLDRVDGFDNNYVGWGLEDSDLVVRLLHAGLRRKDGRFATGVLHLWHAPGDRSQLSANQIRLDGVIASDRINPVRGLSALAGEIQPEADRVRRAR